MLDEIAVHHDDRACPDFARLLSCVAVNDNQLGSGETAPSRTSPLL